MSIQEKIIAILEDEVTAQIHFRCDGTSVWGGGYKIIANKVKTGAIICQPNVNMEDAGSYGFQGDVFRFHPDMGMTSLLDKAMVVHEATHALQDRASRPLNLIDSECPGYIAQCMYLRIAVPNRFLFPIETPLLQLYAVAHNIAGEMLRPGGNRNLEASSPDLQALKQEIRQVAIYGRAQNETRQFDGIRPPPHRH